MPLKAAGRHGQSRRLLRQAAPWRIGVVDYMVVIPALNAPAFLMVCVRIPYSQPGKHPRHCRCPPCPTTPLPFPLVPCGVLGHLCPLLGHRGNPSQGGPQGGLDTVVTF
jgi:hypothetical protein